MSETGDASPFCGVVCCGLGAVSLVGENMISLILENPRCKFWKYTFRIYEELRSPITLCPKPCKRRDIPVTT
jgi:hypothetical protein